NLELVETLQRARTAVDLTSVRLLHGSDQEHVGTLLAHTHLEVIGHAFVQNRGRERTEGFAELGLQVHCRLHVGTPRITEDAPAAQSARAEFHPSLKPAYDILVRQQIGDVIAEPVFAGELSILGAGRIEAGLDLTARETGTQ